MYICKFLFPVCFIVSNLGWVSPRYLHTELHGTECGGRVVDSGRRRPAQLRNDHQVLARVSAAAAARFASGAARRLAEREQVALVCVASEGPLRCSADLPGAPLQEQKEVNRVHGVGQTGRHCEHSTSTRKVSPQMASIQHRYRVYISSGGGANFVNEQCDTIRVARGEQRQQSAQQTGIECVCRRLSRGGSIPRTRSEVPVRLLGLQSVAQAATARAGRCGHRTLLPRRSSW